MALPLTAVSLERGPYRIRVLEQPSDGPPIVLMHGFPDNHHLYDRLVPHLPGRHVVVFDFLGWGESDKPAEHDYTFENQVGDLDAVVKAFGLDRAVLVPHDASGPAAINWAVDHPDQVAAIVALNTFYCDIPGAPLNAPEAIRLFSDPNLARLTAHFAASLDQFRWLYDFQVGGFIQDDDVRRELVPLLFRQFEDQPSSVDAFMQLNADLIPAVLAATERTEELRSFPAPVRVAFGENDPYLTAAYGAGLAALVPRGEATPIAGASHFPQLDAPADVARAIHGTWADTVTANVTTARFNQRVPLPRSCGQRRARHRGHGLLSCRPARSVCRCRFVQDGVTRPRLDRPGHASTCRSSHNPSRRTYRCAP